MGVSRDFVEVKVDVTITEVRKQKQALLILALAPRPFADEQEDATEDANGVAFARLFGGVFASDTVMEQSYPIVVVVLPMLMVTVGWPGVIVTVFEGCIVTVAGVKESRLWQKVDAVTRFSFV
jgi:hypothetical protein